MKHLLPFLLLLLTACDPCNCEDCCGNSFSFSFENTTQSTVETIWYGPVDGQIPADSVLIPPGEEVDLYFAAGLAFDASISSFPFGSEGRFTYDSLDIIINGTISERFRQDDCNRNPLCESAYLDKSERGDRRGDRLRFRYVYE